MSSTARGVLIVESRPSLVGASTDLYGASIKRIVDVILAALLLMILAPVILLTMLLVTMTSRGPAIYRQVRLGRGGRRITIYKIRTMVLDCERESGPTWSRPGDPRVTPLGRWLRRTHLDELLQLVNILRGEMSLVGPRPERPELVGPLERALPDYRRRLAVRPGLTGVAQVLLPPDTDLASVRRKLDCDLDYLENLSAWLDFRVLVGTALTCAGVPHATIGRLLQLCPGETHRATEPNSSTLDLPSPDHAASSA
jgi:lipopolysaccharide/colanic/teichoic acid biosynthesis glycosyltransferase